MSKNNKRTIKQMESAEQIKPSEQINISEQIDPSEQIEIRISEYIDSLNAETEPSEHRHPSGLPEMERLAGIVRLVHSLREPALPGTEFQKKMADIAEKSQPVRKSQPMEKSQPVRKSQPGRSSGKPRRIWFISVAAAAVVIIALVAFNFLPPFAGTNIVYAMEQAYQEVGAYHGILEIIDINASGQEILQSKLEVWADKDGRYYVRDIGDKNENNELITVNNGQKKWQINPAQQQTLLFPVFPDPYSFTFQLGSEIEDVKNALKTEAVGEAVVSGRKTDILEVTPKGGVPYRLWVDRETKLPLQKESGMLNAIQYRVTYTQIDFSEVIPPELMEYTLPEGFTLVDENPEQVANNIYEAAEIIGFTPKLPDDVPDGFVLDSISVGNWSNVAKLYYSSGSAPESAGRRVIVSQSKSPGGFKPASTAVLGIVNGLPAEIQSPVQADNRALPGGWAYQGIAIVTSIRWQEAGIEYTVIGDASPEEMTLFVNSISQGSLQVPEQGLNPANLLDPKDSDFKPQVEVPLNMEIEENEQKSVDGGHTPWKLDPVYVAHIFVSLEMSPKGIVGDYPIEPDAFTVSKNNGSNAIVEVDVGDSPISRVYLRRLIRQDSTGIWTVVGYDPA